jgi:hypothetical protein
MTTDEAPTAAVRFVESWRPRWTDVVLVVMAVGLWVADRLVERSAAVLLLFWPVARTARNQYATTVSQTGISWQVGKQRHDVAWNDIERLIAVEGLVVRNVFLVQRGGKPTALPTPRSFRLTRPGKFGLAVAELQRWATAYGGQLRVENARTYPTWAAVLAQRSCAVRRSGRSPTICCDATTGTRSATTPPPLSSYWSSAWFPSSSG